MKLAIVKLSALGDIVHAMVALQFIKAHDSSIEIDWIVEENFAEMLRFNPDIRHILTVNLKALKINKRAIFSEIKKVRRYAANEYDLVIDAQGLLKSAMTAKFLGSKIAGFDKDSIREKLAAYFYHTGVASAYDENTIDRNVKVLSAPLGFQVTSEQIQDKHAFLYYQENNAVLNDYLSSDKKNIVLVIGSTWASRNYPKEKFLQVAESLQQNCLILWGNQTEKNTAEWIATHSNYAQVLPKITLNDVKTLIAKADLTIGNDTGPTHIAWGLNKPSLVLFGCTPVSRVYQTKINRVLKSSSMVNVYKLNKQDDSIKDIQVDDVVKIATELLANESV